MNDQPEEFTEEEIVDAVAEALTEHGLDASPQDTGGGISCVVVAHKDGGEIVWGTADVNWGGALHNEDGEYLSAIQTDCPSDSQEVSAIVETILNASVRNGAVTREP